MELQAISPQIEIRTRLRQEWDRLREKNPSFSMRAFAKRLGIAHSAVSEILNSDRTITRKMAMKILSKLGTDPVESERIVGNLKREKTTAFPTKTQVQLAADQYNVIADWYHYAILSLLETDRFSGEPDEISDRPGIAKSKVSKALVRSTKKHVISINYLRLSK